MTLEQGHGDQFCCKSVDPLQDYNNAKFEKPCLNSVHDVANDKGFVKSGKHVNYLHRICSKAKSSGIFMTLK